MLKEGIYEDTEQRDGILGLVRFRSTASKGWVSLGEYLQRMKPGQEAIYTFSGEDAEALRKNPHLESFLAKGVEVLLLTDPVDEFWIPAVARFEGKPFRSITRGATDLSKIEGGPQDSRPERETAAPEVDRLIALLKLTLKDAVKDVRRSGRLTQSPVVLVADEYDLDIHLERLLRQHNQLDRAALRILEINPTHPLIRSMASALKVIGDSQSVTDAALLLLDQARILDGEVPPDPAGFADRLSRALERGGWSRPRLLRPSGISASNRRHLKLARRPPPSRLVLVPSTEGTGVLVLRGSLSLAAPEEYAAYEAGSLRRIGRWLRKDPSHRRVGRPQSTKHAHLE